MNNRLSPTSIVSRNADAAYVHLRTALEDLVVDPVVHTDRVCVANSIDLSAVHGHYLRVAPWSLRPEGGPCFSGDQQTMKRRFSQFGESCGVIHPS